MKNSKPNGGVYNPYQQAAMRCKKTLIPEKELVRALKNGEMWAMEVLNDQYHEALSGIISRVLRKDNVQDELQEVLIKIWNSFDRYDSSKGTLFTWIYRIAEHYAIDIYRSKPFRDAKKLDDVDTHQTEIEYHNRVSFNPDGVGLKDMVNALQPQLREVVQLAYFKGYTNQQTAKELNIPIGTVKTRIRMAVIQLRRYFAFGLPK